VEPAEEHRWVASAFTERVTGTVDWDATAPVEGWVARDVVRHLVEWFPAFLEAGAGVVLSRGPSVDDDPVTAWRVHADAVQALLDDPGTPSKVLSNPHIGEVPLDRAVDQFYTADVFMHTWDLARATGQDDTIEPAELPRLWGDTRALGDQIRSEGTCGPELPAPPDATEQDRLLAYLGRDPRFVETSSTA